VAARCQGRLASLATASALSSDRLRRNGREWQHEPIRSTCAAPNPPLWHSPIAAINAHSGRVVVRPPRSFLAHRPLGRLFFRFTGPIECSRQQRLRFAQQLARRRMASAIYSHYPTLSPLSPRLSSVPSSAPLRLRSGSSTRIVAPAATRGCCFGGDDCSLCW
jgi:hypothetical protein